MRILAITCLTLVAFATVAVAFATVAPAGAQAAIVNKQLEKRKHRQFGNPMQMAKAIFDGSSKAQTAVGVATAATLLGALAATIAGLWQVVRGERGGVSLTTSGVYGLIGLLAAFSVIK